MMALPNADKIGQPVILFVERRQVYLIVRVIEHVARILAAYCSTKGLLSHLTSANTFDCQPSHVQDEPRRLISVVQKSE